MEGFLLSKNRILHSKSKCLIFFMRQYYEYIKEPYSLVFPHSAKTAFFLLTHFQTLLCLVSRGPWPFRNQLFWSHHLNLVKYFMALDLYERCCNHYEKLKWLSQCGLHNIYKAIKKKYQMSCWHPKSILFKGIPSVWINSARLEKFCKVLWHKSNLKL